MMPNVQITPGQNGAEQEILLTWPANNNLDLAGCAIDHDDFKINISNANTKLTITSPWLERDLTTDNITSSIAHIEAHLGLQNNTLMDLINKARGADQKPRVRFGKN